VAADAGRASRLLSIALAPARLHSSFGNSPDPVSMIPLAARDSPSRKTQVVVWIVSLALVVGYISVGRGRIPFVAAWATAIPAWVKVASALLLYALGAVVFVGIHRGVPLGKGRLPYCWLFAFVVAGYWFAVCFAADPAVFMGLTFGLYPVKLLCRGCVWAFGRKARRA
jgi:hypothetical protein